MGATIAEALARYQPKMDTAYWRQIGPFVVDCVDLASPDTRYSDKELFAAAAPLTLWAWQSAGMELERHQVFSRATIERFIDSGLTGYSTSASRNTLRSRLNRMSEILHSSQTITRALRPLGNSDPMTPYTPADVVQLRSWAAAQQTESRRRNAHILLALGLGAGLTAKELLAVRSDDITCTDEGVHVAVTGARPRQVTVLREWETHLLDAQEDGWLFRQRRHGHNRNLITDFVSHSEQRVDLQTRRMRSTWIVHHFTVGTPTLVLLAASGVQSLVSLDRFVRFAPLPNPIEASRRLRGPTDVAATRPS
ncbi:hypothetical protein [Microcella sp.]|uniref:hypothetical protein n=1 Tax=Microcella sp. TaxID=1913979 RepID=UPI00391953C5